MRFVIVTGVSGAGKTAALKMLEDARYFCVDNLPIPLLEKFVSLMPEIHGEDVQNVALGIDARSGSMGELELILDKMQEAGYQFEILFMDAEDSVLVKRYKETRRSHPLAMSGRIDEGIRLESKRMEFLRRKADYIIRITSHLLTRELRQEIDKIFVDNEEFKNMMISVLSFGFEYGIPADADFVFDVRFLPNPYYVDELRPMTGLDDSVFNYVMDNGDCPKRFMGKLEDMVNFLIPNSVQEEKQAW